MKQTNEVVSIIADHVSHVRPVPPGKTAEDVKQEFFEERARKTLAAKGDMIEIVVPKNEIKLEINPKVDEPEKDETKTATYRTARTDGVCGSCGKTFKRLDAHRKWCKGPA